MSEVDKLIKHIKQMERLILSLQPSATNIPSFEAFDPLKELWKDY